ncbi:hypothetical protein DS972_13515 [Escherichia coli]|nr:hypothetical protein [Escherichia coli]RBX92282.1 hypothetical protein DS974_15285 [Escherichia coli]RBY04683.1 hypothetical protein DS972_13515 [Escherichia coli]RBY45855.1 hypothetical protein DS989_21485 [Escherichia coli]RCY72652.1 hypothetical protein DTL90_13335 [Escherichia coli]
MMSLWDALRMNMMISYQELVRTFPKFVDPKEKEGLMVQHSNGQLVITGKYCPEGVQTAFTQEQYDKLIRYINIFFTFPKLE